MTTNENEMRLQTLFQEAAIDLDGEAFTDDVVAKTRRLVYRVASILAGLVLMFLVSAWWFAVPVQELSLLITHFLASPLVNLGEGWAGWVFTPIKNIAALIALCAKVLRMAWKKRVSNSYS